MVSHWYYDIDSPMTHMVFSSSQHVPPDQSIGLVGLMTRVVSIYIWHLRQRPEVAIENPRLWGFYCCVYVTLVVRWPNRDQQDDPSPNGTPKLAPEAGPRSWTWCRRRCGLEDWGFDYHDYSEGLSFGAIFFASNLWGTSGMCASWMMVGWWERSSYGETGVKFMGILGSTV